MKKLFDFFRKKPQETQIKNIYATSMMFFVDYEKNLDIEYFFGDMNEQTVEILGKFIYSLNKGLILPIIIEDLVTKSKGDLQKIQFVTSVIKYIDQLYAEDKVYSQQPIVSPSSTFSKHAK